MAKKGVPNAGQIKPGEVRNPGGRPKTVGLVREMAQGYTETAIQTLAEICGRGDMPAAARVSAANALLDRGYGRPEATHNVNVNRSAKDLSYDELIQIASGEGIAGAQEGAGITPGLH